ncbi:MAG TPA: MarP family serine protease [Candidatus Limnocylindrales bacterium]|nr:MarP family serine protease [Candidatus Limnocylindrales bacterium]
MNAFDLAVLVLFVAAVLIGLNSGAIPQLAGLLGALGGGVLAIVALPWLEGLLTNLEPPIRAITVLVGILFLVGIGEAIGSALGQAVAMRLRGGVLGTVDRFSGGLVGGAQALLIVWLIGGLLAAGPMRGLAAQAQTSFVVRGLNAILPAPTEIAAELGRLLSDTGIPDLFVGLEPLPAAPVDLPNDPTARAIAAAARSSTVKVSAGTCEFISTGTGFVIARGYVVTNAHVVAGATTIRVLWVGGILFDAVAVFDDPELDVALLWVPRLEAPSLRFAAADPARGATGATLGYPHGGGLTIAPAAVAGAYIATGRDIYGDERVSRRILELRAEVDQGDSGGPFILADGSVGGVVFAEARTDEAVGYALTATSVATAIAPQIGRTGPVDTGRCIR